MTYVVVAYRWGWTNGHQYLVCAASDKEKAVDEAGKEATESDGKYGVAVYSLSDSRDGDFHLEAYFPSAYGEEKPHWNARLAMFGDVGTKVVRAIEDGKHEDVPPWLMEVVGEKLEWYKAAGEVARTLDVSNL
jgi:hypothetical protein